MSHKEEMQNYLAGFGVHLPVEEFTTVTSNIYHALEAQNYDERHFSIAYSKKYWSRVTEYLNGHFEGQANLSVFDFGCGTGFATEQLLQSRLNNKISRLSCYDLSPEMVEVCRQKFAADTRLSYYSGPQGLGPLIASGQTYAVIVCNALMHHILEPRAVFEMIDTLLEPGGVFVMGHEPNKNFYSNRVLQIASQMFRFYKKASRKIFRRNRRVGPDIAELTQKELVIKNIVPEHFPSGIVPKFVDIHVPLANYTVQPWGENGFDLAYVNRFLSNRFSVMGQVTYSHIKDQEAYKSFFWRNFAALLAHVFPQDGADAIFIFKKDKIPT